MSRKLSLLKNKSAMIYKVACAFITLLQVVSVVSIHAKLTRVSFEPQSRYYNITVSINKSWELHCFTLVRHTLSYEDKKNHLDSTKFEINGSRKHFTLHLHKNRYLLPSAFVVISQLDNGTDHIEKAIEQCYYHGHLGNPERTAVAVDTCNGLKGIIQDDNGEEYFIEPHVLYKTSSEYHNKHVLYKTKDLKIKKQGMCGNNLTADAYFKEINTKNYIHLPTI
ncbi:disintegrin and metalloproteinase domain-containing protein 23-like [Hydractinia symbiolongicarpus]|uniref:disintegrin and metalloproteinase domain-containing protein 23-like n=1 Tax=Hydractinia symbiolongicarpus TaxID=13093 RepID=UPI00254B0E06|nr:disintegrin and metalloproteinase domain-containing protein 23-like [Hydractinia symbiolongicarpus]